MPLPPRVSDRPAILLSDLDPAIYPQPAFLARALAREFGECLLIDDAGVRRTSRMDLDALEAHPSPPSRTGHAVASARFLARVATARPRVVIAVNEPLAALAATSRFLAPADCLLGLYLLDYWEDLPARTMRMRAGRRALAGRAGVFDLVIDCEPGRLARRAWIEPGTARFILRNSPPEDRAPHPPAAESDIDADGETDSRARRVPRLIYAGAGHRHVCLEALIDAIGLLPSRADGTPALEADFFVRAPDSRLAELRAHVAARAPRAAIRVLAAVPKSELYAEYARASIGACFYRHDAGVNLNAVLCAPNKVHESMACGLALLLSDNPTLLPFEAAGAGTCVNPLDPGSIAAGLARMLEGNRYRAMGRVARRLHETEMSFERGVAPILEFLRTPRRPKRFA